MEQLLERAAADGWSVYVLGAREEVLEQAIVELRVCIRGSARRLAPRLLLACRRGGRVVEEIAAERPQLLFVALETPAKELFLERNIARLSPVFAMGVGGAVDVFAGRKKRAPRWLQRSGLEWLYRFLQDPRRLARPLPPRNARFLGLLGVSSRAVAFAPLAAPPA